MAKYDSVKERSGGHLSQPPGEKNSATGSSSTRSTLPPSWMSGTKSTCKVRVVYDGDGGLLEPNWLNGLYWQMRSELLALGVVQFPF